MVLSGGALTMPALTAYWPLREPVETGAAWPIQINYNPGCAISYTEIGCALLRGDAE